MIYTIFQAHGGEENIKHHPFFRDVKWRELEERRVKPPFKPKIVRNLKQIFLQIIHNNNNLLVEKQKRGNQF